MQYKAIVRALGLLLLAEAVLMIPSLVVALYDGGGDAPYFMAAMAVLVAIGLPPSILIRNRAHNLYPREGFVLVGLGWLLLSLFGALPLLLYPNFVTNPADAFFESVSGFSTTGATILTDIEALPRGLLFWRSFTHWVGGMGVIVLTVALLPQLGVRSVDILKAEGTGPTPGKIMPRIRDTAKALYGLYLGLSLLMLIALGITGMPLYDGLVTVFSTAGTGGFSVLNHSIAGYQNRASESVVALFMLLFSINFALYYAMITRQFNKVLSNIEFIVFVCIAVISTALITKGVLPIYHDVYEAFHHAFFQVSAMMSTTGFTIDDFSRWPVFTKMILMLLMVIGGCAGSTSGGLKVVRLVLAGKAFRRELHLVLRRRIVRTVMFDGKPLTEATMRAVLVYFYGYVAMIALTTLIVAFDGIDLSSSFTAALTMISNGGPGLGIVGPGGNYAEFSNLSKLALSFCMLVGRLEIMPVLLLFLPSTWKKI